MPKTREQLFRRLGIITHSGPKLHARTIRAYRSLEMANLGQGRFKSSFWGGSFPALEKPCGRHALYGLLNLPETYDDVAHPKLVATAQAGKDAENQITRRWGMAGMTIAGSVPLSDEVGSEQLRLQVPEYWYSAAIDSVLDLRPEWDCVTPVDIKSKADVKIDDMDAGRMECDPRHRAQVLGYCYACRLFHEEMGWAAMGLKPSQGGFVYYVSRDNPSRAHEYWIEYDESEVDDALKLLAEWKGLFLGGKLPPRPKEWRWTLQPCQWCDFKKRCKEDAKNGVEVLFDSEAVRLAKKVDETYDPSKVQEKVRRRWEAS